MGVITYLDHNATTPLRPAALAAMAEALAITGNASSVHRFGRRVRRLIEDAREHVAALVGAQPSGVVFTGGGSEANNLALGGAGRRVVLVSAVEHDSVLNGVPGATRVPVDGNGVIDQGALERLLSAAELPALVSVMAANNETGVLQPLAEVARLARRHGALVHCDGVQGVGRIPLDMDALGLHMLTLSAHKLGGPQGVGALVLAGDVEVAALIRGGGQERGRRAGTENAAAIAGFGATAAIGAALQDEHEGLRRLRDGLEARLRCLVPGLRVFGGAADRLANTSCLAMPGVSGETQVMSLDMAGIAVSAGSACSSGKIGASHVLKAMGVDDGPAGQAIRVSLGWTNGAADVDRLLDAWEALYARAGTPAPYVSRAGTMV